MAYSLQRLCGSAFVMLVSAGCARAGISEAQAPAGDHMQSGRESAVRTAKEPATTREPSASAVTAVSASNTGSSSGETAASPGDSGAGQAEQPASAAAEAFRLTGRPRDIITGENTSYSLNFSASQAGIEAKERCQSEFAEDPERAAQCLERARDKLGVTVLRFVKKRDGWHWLTYRRKGSDLIVLHNVPFEFGQETENSVTLRPTGKDRGLAAWARVPKEVVIRLPNSYSIELDDPEHGRMAFDAKIGMIAD